MTTRKKSGFTLLEIMIVVLVISILLGIAIPQFLSSRSKSQAQSCASNLRQISQAKEQCAMNNSLNDGATVTATDLNPYIKSTFPTCPAGGSYTIHPIGTNPSCSKETNTPPHILP